jgi:hypothetical protein
MLSQIVRQVMEALEMNQAAFAQAIGASLDRVKSMTSGRVSKLHPSEQRMLVEEFGVRGDFLATGSGPVLARDVPAPPEPQSRSVQRDVDALDIPASYRRPTRDLVAAVSLGDSAMALEAIADIVAAAHARSRLKAAPELRLHDQRGSYGDKPGKGG